MGFNLLKRLADDVAEDGTIESAPKQDGRNMLMALAATRKKTEARVEVEAAKAAKAADRAAAAEEERRQEAELRAAAATTVHPKKKRGPADNMDPDVDL